MLIASLLLIVYGKATVYAGTYDNAYSYYKAYGNRAVFKATTETNGYIYCGTKGKNASTDTRYKTIGWKMTCYNLDNKVLQTLYFKLGGDYLKTISSKSAGGYTYGLYRMELATLKSRLNAKTMSALEKGNCRMVLDACMVVVKGGKVGGAMDDKGIKSGKVYTTFSGIKSAAAWNSAARTALLTYFKKNVENLFYNITVKKDAGIMTATGAGTYCYGTTVTLKAEALDGYSFYGWKNDKLYSSATKKIIVTKNDTWIAMAGPVSLIINYYRNFNRDDNVRKSKSYVYGVNNQKISRCEWTLTGYHFAGWALSRGGDNCYNENQPIDPKWLVLNHDEVNLYAEYAPNTYRIHYVGAKDGNIPDEVKSYDDYVYMPQNGSALGWSIDPDNKWQEYDVGDRISVSHLASRLGVENVNNATITLYALWDNLPVIDANDLYYSLDIARSGRITEEELASHARAYDIVDGEIGYGFNPDNYFIIPVYYSRWFTHLSGDANVPVDFIASNSSGGIVETQIMVHIVDTSIATEHEKDYKIRFISDKYYKNSDGRYVDEKAGGLIQNSCWKSNIYFKNLLETALGA